MKHSLYITFIQYCDQTLHRGGEEGNLLLLLDSDTYFHTCYNENNSVLFMDS